MQIIKRRMGEIANSGVRRGLALRHQIPGKTKEWHVLDGKNVALCPSVRTERFPSFDKGSRTKLPPSVDFHLQWKSLSRVSSQAVRGLSVSGRCAFGASPPLTRELVSSAGVF